MLNTIKESTMPVLVISDTKICNKCHIEKETTFFHKDKKGPLGIMNTCKECRGIKSKLIYAHIQSDPILKLENKRKDKEYKDKNKDRAEKKNKILRDMNKDRKVEYDKAYNKKNKARKAKRDKKYREENKDKLDAYKQTPMGRAVQRNKGLKRRALKKAGDVKSIELMELKESAKLCYWCNIPLKKKKTHYDHYMPLSLGGLHTISNIVMACERCNLTKSAKDPIRFANEIGKLF